MDWKVRNLRCWIMAPDCEEHSSWFIARWKDAGLRSAQSKEDPPSNGALRLQRNQQDKPRAVGSLGSHVNAAEGFGLRSLQKLNVCSPSDGWAKWSSLSENLNIVRSFVGRCRNAFCPFVVLETNSAIHANLVVSAFKDSPAAHDEIWDKIQHTALKTLAMHTHLVSCFSYLRTLTTIGATLCTAFCGKLIFAYLRL